MWARISRIEGSPEALDAVVANVNDEVIPGVKQMPGFAGAYFLADRETGRFLAMTLWDSEEQLRAGEEAANRLREGSASATGGTITGVERYEVIAQG